QVMKGEILPHIGWPVIPVLKTAAGEYVQDTADIIDHYEAVLSGPRVMPEGPLQHFVSLLFQLFADEWLTLPAMHYRWNYNEDWIYGEFGKNAAPDGTPEQQYEAGKAVGARFRGFVPMLGITEDTAPGIERAYEQFLADFSAHLEHLPYVFGNRASFADFALIGPLYAHQYRDKYAGEHMKRTAPHVADWVERVIAGQGREGSLLAEDDLPKTLLPILQVQMAEQLPTLLATNDLLGNWAASATSGDAAPRGFDMIPFETGGSKGQCMARSFPLWRLQAALDVFSEMSASDTERTTSFLQAIGGEALLAYKPAARLARINYRLCLA
ncbi:MAG: glutathione binding-like protein, partial [Pseudomonadota bacterium]